MEFGPKTWAQVVGGTPNCCATPTPTAAGAAPRCRAGRDGTAAAGAAPRCRAGRDDTAAAGAAPRCRDGTAAAGAAPRCRDGRDSTAAAGAASRCRDGTAAAGRAPAQPVPDVTPRAARRSPELAAASTAAWRPESPTHAWPRLGIGSPLPNDVLEAILGFLDLETLCTARLVSKTFCAAGSAHIRTMTCRGICHAISGQRFPRLARMAVCHSGRDGDLADVDPHLRDLITSLKISDCKGSLRRTLSQLASMPKLRELEVKLDVGGTAPLLRDCTNLEILRLSAPECSSSVATTIASMASLREIHIRRAFRPGNRLEVSWLHRATILRHLQALALSTASDALPPIRKLTGLTGLTWVCVSPQSSSTTEVAYTISPLTRLSKLRSVRLGKDMSASNVDIACSLGGGSLVNLALGSAHDCGSFLARQTALTRLSVLGGLCNLRHIGALRIELLQSLTLRPLFFLDAEGGRLALCKATSLTELRVQIATGFAGLELPSLPLSHAFAGLTGLRALVLSSMETASSAASVKLLDYALALQPLTRLSHLEISGGHLEDRDLRALLVLTGLRVLRLDNSCLTDDVVPDLSVLTNLKMLNLIHCGISSVEAAASILNPLRHARGWPHIDARIGWEQ